MKAFVVFVVFVIFVLLLLSINASAQNITVSGRVTAENRNAAYIAVSLVKSIDSALVKTVLTDTAGRFEFKNVMPGNYIIKISATGFSNYVSQVMSVSASTQLPVISIEPTAKVLSEVKVIAQKPLVEEKIDKTVMNIENSILATGNNALEILEQAPHVSVDNDGNITLRGIQGVTVMIDGKLTYLSSADLANFLRNTPGSQIAQIEIITNPSSRFEAAGSGGIINIKMKKNLDTGVNGAYNFNWQQGRLPRINTGVNLNYRKGKINMYGGLTYSDSRRWNEDISVTEFTNGGVSTGNFNVFEDTRYKTRSLNVRAGMDYSLSAKTTVGLLLNISGGDENINAITTNTIKSIGFADSSLLTTNNGFSKWQRYAANYNVNHQFDTAGRVISLDIDAANFKDDDNPFYVTDYFNHSGAKTQTLLLDGDMHTNVNMFSIKSDYEHPLNGKGTLSAGVKSSYVQTKNSILYFRNKILDNGMSNDFRYTEIINAVYIDYGGNKNKWNYKFGVRAEQTIAKGEQLTTTSRFNRNYTQLFPTLFLKYRWNKSFTSGLTANRRIGRPDYESLNPFIYFSDPYNSWSGNPYLRPAITYNVNITNSYKNMLNLFAGYSKTIDMFSRVQVRDTVSSGVFSSWENLGSSEQFSVGVGGTLQPAKWWRMNTHLVLFQNRSRGQLGALTANRTLNCYRIFTNNSFKLSSTIDAEASFWYRSPTLWAVMRTAPVGNFSAGIQKKIFNNQGTIKFMAVDIFRQMKLNTDAVYQNIITTSHIEGENRAFRIALTYRFGRRQVKAERERTTALEDENSRVKGRE